MPSGERRLPKQKNCRAELGRGSKSIPQLMKKGKREEAEALKASLRDLGDRKAALGDEAKRLESGAGAAAVLYPEPAVADDAARPGRKLSDCQNARRCETL